MLGHPVFERSFANSTIAPSSLAKERKGDGKGLGADGFVLKGKA